MISKLAITSSNQAKREIEKEDEDLKEKCFQDLKTLGSLCKVVGALGFMHYIFTYAPKSFKN